MRRTAFAKLALMALAMSTAGVARPARAEILCALTVLGTLSVATGSRLAVNRAWRQDLANGSHIMIHTQGLERRTPVRAGLSLIAMLAVAAAMARPVHAGPVIGDLLVGSTTSNPSVLSFSGTTGTFKGPFVPAGSGGLKSPSGLAFGPDGNLYVGDFYGGSVLRYNGTTGAFIDAFVSPGSGGLSQPTDLTFGPDNNLYVLKDNPSSSSMGSAILSYSGINGSFNGTFSLINGGLAGPLGLVFGPDSNLYVSNSIGSTSDILRYDGKTGAFIDVFASGGGLVEPVGLTFGRDGNLYVSDFRADDVKEYSGINGQFIRVFASGGGLSLPEGLVFGPDGNLYVTSAGSNSVLRYDGTTGAFLGVFASGGNLDVPVSLIFSPSVTVPVPEPASVVMGGTAALVGLGYWWHCRRQALI